MLSHATTAACDNSSSSVATDDLSFCTECSTRKNKGKATESPWTDGTMTGTAASEDDATSRGGYSSEFAQSSDYSSESCGSSSSNTTWGPSDEEMRSASRNSAFTFGFVADEAVEGGSDAVYRRSGSLGGVRRSSKPPLRGARNGHDRHHQGASFPSAGLMQHVASASSSRNLRPNVEIVEVTAGGVSQSEEEETGKRSCSSGEDNRPHDGPEARQESGSGSETGSGSQTDKDLIPSSGPRSSPSELPNPSRRSFSTSEFSKAIVLLPSGGSLQLPGIDHHATSPADPLTGHHHEKFRRSRHRLPGPPTRRVGDIPLTLTAARNGANQAAVGTRTGAQQVRRDLMASPPRAIGTLKWPYVLYISMEPVPGITLDIWLKKRDHDGQLLLPGGSSVSRCADGLSSAEGSLSSSSSSSPSGADGALLALPLMLREEKAIFKQIVLGLLHCHSAGIIHRGKYGC